MLQTDRLDLLMLTREDLAVGLLSLPNLAKRLNLTLVPNLLTGVVRSAVEKKLLKMEGVPPDEAPWFTYWLIVIRAESIGAGTVGFKGLPNALGEVEIGYGIDPQYQNKGYMTEAVKSMVTWAFKDPNCKVVTAILSAPGNFASHRVLEKSGFHKYYHAADGLSFCIERPNA